LRGHGLLQQFNVALEITPQKKSEMNTKSNSSYSDRLRIWHKFSLFLNITAWQI